MKQRIIAFICSVVLIATAVFICDNVFANNISWQYDINSKTLYITGNGSMEDYTKPYEAPWGIYILEMQNLIVGDGVTSIGNYAFAGSSSLNNVTIADSVSKLGSGSFSETQSLTELTLSSNITSIGDASFAKMGADDKTEFQLNVNSGSFALYYAINNNISFWCDNIVCGEQQVDIKKNTGMRAYYPYKSAVNGTFSFYSVSKNDPIGYVYDSNFNLVATNDDHGSPVYENMEDCDFAISVNLVKGETYYFATDIYSPTSAASFSVYIIPTNYTVTGDIRAVISSDGTLTDSTLSDATLNGEATNGTYQINITELNYEGTFFWKVY